MAPDTAPNGDQDRITTTAAPRFVGGRVEHCGACLGTGTVADHSPDGSFDPVDCDACHGWGYTRVDSKGRHRDPMGRFCG